MNWKEAHDTAVEAAREAGEILCEGLKAEKKITRKSSAVDLLTEYDQAAESMIVGRLKAAYPEHLIVAEEGSPDNRSESDQFHIWFVDPLDGTNNYAHGYPVFAVSIALYEKDSPCVGVVYDPTRNECFHAIAGAGAWLTSQGDSLQLRVSERTELVESLLATGFPYDRHHSAHDNIEATRAFLKNALGVRRAGSASLDLAYVATGRLDGYWEYKLSPWDVAAGLLLVQEAGGIVSGMGGENILLSKSVSMVASNAKIHNAMLGILNKVMT